MILLVLCFLGCVAALFSVFLRFAENELPKGKPWAIAVTVIFTLTLVVLLVAMAIQPHNKTKCSLKVSPAVMSTCTYLRESSIKNCPVGSLTAWQAAVTQ